MESSQKRPPPECAASPDIERASRAIEEFLAALGRSASNEPELLGTGRRVAEAFANDLLCGYGEDPADILKEHTASTSKGLVAVTSIQVTAMCPHHLLPALGVAHVAYRPGPRVVGLGALASLVDCFARRLILQEDLCERVANALVEHLEARAAVCMVHLEPTCVVARGGRRHGTHATSSAFAGEEASDALFRNEFWTAVTCATHESSSISSKEKSR